MQSTNKHVGVMGVQKFRLKSEFYKLYGSYNDLIRKYKLSLGRMLSEVFISIVKPLFTYWYYGALRLPNQDIARAHGGCDQLTVKC